MAELLIVTIGHTFQQHSIIPISTPRLVISVTHTIEDRCHPIGHLDQFRNGFRRPTVGYQMSTAFYHQSSFMGRFKFTKTVHCPSLKNDNIAKHNINTSESLTLENILTALNLLILSYSVLRDDAFISK